MGPESPPRKMRRVPRWMMGIVAQQQTYLIPLKNTVKNKRERERTVCLKKVKMANFTTIKHFLK